MEEQELNELHRSVRDTLDVITRAYMEERIGSRDALSFLGDLTEVALEKLRFVATHAAHLS